MRQDTISLLNAIGCRVLDDTSINCFGVDIEIHWLDPKYFRGRDARHYRSLLRSNVVEIRNDLIPEDETHYLGEAVGKLLSHENERRRQKFLEGEPPPPSMFEGMDFSGPGIGGALGFAGDVVGGMAKAAIPTKKKKEDTILLTGAGDNDGGILPSLKDGVQIPLLPASKGRVGGPGFSSGNVIDMRKGLFGRTWKAQ